MLNSRIQQRFLKENSVYLPLISVELSKGEIKLRLSEAILHFPKKVQNFQFLSQPAIPGHREMLSEVSIDKNRLILDFTDVLYRNTVFPQNEPVR